MTILRPRLQRLTLLFAGIALAVFAGCAPSGPSPAVTKRMEFTDSLTEKIESLKDCIGEVKDVDSFLAQKPKVMEIIGSVEELAAALPEMPKLEDGEKEKYSEEFAAARAKVEAAAAALSEQAKDAMKNLTSQPLDQQMKIMPAVMELMPKMEEIGKKLAEARKYIE